ENRPVALLRLVAGVQDADAGRPTQAVVAAPPAPQVPPATRSFWGRAAVAARSERESGRSAAHDGGAWRAMKVAAALSRVQPEEVDASAAVAGDGVMAVCRAGGLGKRSWEAVEDTSVGGGPEGKAVGFDVWGRLPVMGPGPSRASFVGPCGVSGSAPALGEGPPPNGL